MKYKRAVKNNVSIVTVDQLSEALEINDIDNAVEMLKKNIKV